MREQKTADILTHIVITPLILSSLIGNIFTIIVKLHRKKWKIFNSGDLLIMNLAICDLNKTWAMYIVWIYTYVIANQWNFSNIGCIIFQRSVVILFSVTSMTLLVLTVERYFLIVKPFNRSFTLKRTAIGLVLIWMLVILITAIPNFSAFHTVQANGVRICIPVQHRTTWVYAVEAVYFIIFIFIPLIAIFYLSGKAAKRLRMSSKSCCNQMKVSRKFNEKMRRNKNAINMLRSITLGSAMCYAPWAASFLIETHNREFLVKNLDGTMLQPLFAWMIFGGFCNAPMTYFFFSKEFRKEAKRVFLIRKRSVQGTSTRITPR